MHDSKEANMRIAATFYTQTSPFLWWHALWNVFLLIIFELLEIGASLNTTKVCLEFGKLFRKYLFLWTRRKGCLKTNHNLWQHREWYLVNFYSYSSFNKIWGVFHFRRSRCGIESKIHHIYIESDNNKKIIRGLPTKEDRVQGWEPWCTA